MNPLEYSPFGEQQIAMALLAHAARDDGDAIAAMLDILAEPNNPLDLLSIITDIFDECRCAMPVLAEPFDTQDSLSIISTILDECRCTMRECGDDLAQRFSAEAVALASQAAAF
ncbi:hypothetical protein [Nocardia terpenica]|uniref:Uncharacterized protein n=1 Tax=Nocardia terpenica TaxID=455432 RepID=A0A164PEP5_9NOCA|nr:hypothetical protein [Nocardia terpenica]KZM75470.1 hypothetical protein AWN90_19000 [Nocardia terpenica]NQE85939.1 hypothetical protein [Nocardia terpenica]